MSSFIHLRNYSAYSLSEGAIKIKKFPVLCHNFKMPAVAITDSNNLFGALECATLCAHNGIQLIIGATLGITLLEDSTSPVVVLAQNEVGYLNLIQLVSQPFLQKRSLILDDLKRHHAGLILLSGGACGPIGTLISANKWTEAKDLTRYFMDIFSGRFYIEIERHGTEIEFQTESAFLSLSDEFTLPLVATNSCYFNEPSDYESHDALLCIADGTYIFESKRRRITPHHYFKSSSEMSALFHDLPEAIQNTQWIAKRCAFIPRERPPLLPSFPCTEFETEQAELAHQARIGLEDRLTQEVYPLHPNDQWPDLHTHYTHRLDYELDIINTMGFNGYFLIVSDFIKWAKSHAIPVGPGRGSGAGSLVAWVLTITDMDPIRFGLIFERFLNPERVSMPDFDIDFCQDRRDEVISYVQTRYGADRVAHIITFGKLQARAVLRDVGRVLQMPYPQVDRICKLIPSNPANPVTLKEAIDAEPILQQMQEEDETVARLMAMGQKLEGLYRHASTHAAGVVISDRPLLELIPLYLDDKSSLPATQFSMKYAEAAGLVKFDFLGLKTLTVIEKVCILIRKTNNPHFLIQTIPLDDAKTFELLCHIQTVGVFQIEGAGMRDVLQKLRPDRFEDLIALVALYRPGPMDDIPRYLACKHGEEKIHYLHPTLEPILESTYGVMVYQEQVMKIAQVLGGYTLGAADLLRRAMGKKIKSEMDAQRAIFTSGAVQNGIDAEIAELIFNQMAKFAGYGFNKSHSAPYALLSYQTAYLKANYPKEFFAATMTCDLGNIDKLWVYHEDMRTLGIPLYPPDINASSFEFVTEGDGVRYALSALKNVGVHAIELIVEERTRNGRFTSLTDFTKRFMQSNLNKRQFEHLIFSGALDSLWSNRAELAAHVDLIYHYNERALQRKLSKQRRLFVESDETEELNFPSVPSWSKLACMNHEFESIGFFLTGHPVSLYRHLKTHTQITRSNQIKNYKESLISLMGALLFKQERTSKSGNKFAFAYFCDEYGSFEVAFFSNTYQDYRDLLKEGNLFLVECSVKRGEDEIRLIAKTITPLETLQENQTHYSIKISDETDIDALLERIKSFHPGQTKIILDIVLRGAQPLKIHLKEGYSVRI